MKKKFFKKRKSKYNSDSSKFAITKIRMKNNYGPFKNGCDYRVIGHKNDWVLAKNGGSPFYIPLSFVEINPSSYHSDEEDNFEFDYSEYYDF